MNEWISQGTSERSDEHFGSGADSQILGDFPKADCRICPNTRLLVVGGFSEVF